MAHSNHRNPASRPSIYQTVTERILSSLKAGVIPWEKPWKTPRYAGGPFPRNFYTGKPYRGINVLLLWSSEYSSPFWLTFKQAQALQGNVRKGEHGTPIVFYKQLPEHAARDEEIYTNDAKALGYELSRYVSHPTAIQKQTTPEQQDMGQKVGPQPERGPQVDISQGMSVV
jgi:antirestriction protein ArdC